MGNSIWIILFAILSIIEIVTFYLVSIWFALASLIVYFLSFVITSLNIQLGIFTLLSLIFLVYTMPIVRKYVFNTSKNEVGDIGNEVEILSREDKNYVVKFKGVKWNAFSEENEYVIGDKVKIKKFEGNKIII